MKKITAILMALMLAAVATVTAFAAGINENEQAVLDELNTTIAMKNGDMKIPTGFINQATNYFNTIEMTSDESKQIIAVLQEGKKYAESTGAANIADMTYEQKVKLLDYGKKVVGIIDMTMSYDKPSKTLYIYAPDGTVAFEAVPELVSVDASGKVNQTGKTTGDVIKTTGSAADFSGFIVLGSIVLLVVAASGVAFAVRAKKRA